MSHAAEIRTTNRREDVVEPESIVVKHHRAGVAEMRVPQLSGGRLLHLSLAGCVFNNVLRMAVERGMHVRDVAVKVDGDFTADGASTGIDCTIHIDGESDKTALRKLARDAFDDSTVAAVLKRATRVSLTPD
jgi:uncharacterized OsmC-like protein